jgi:hypothetical protein
MTFLAQRGASLFEQQLELRRVGVRTARDPGAADVSVGAVDDGQVEFTVTILWRPGHALKGFKCAVGNQKSFVDTQRGSHGVFSLYAQSSDMPMVGLTVRLVLVLMPATGVWVTHK